MQTNQNRKPEVDEYKARMCQIVKGEFVLVVVSPSHEFIFKNLANTSSDPFLKTSTPRAGSNVRTAGRGPGEDFKGAPGRIEALSGRDKGEITSFPTLDVSVDAVGNRTKAWESSETVDDTSDALSSRFASSVLRLTPS